MLEYWVGRHREGVRVCTSHIRILMTSLKL